ncbi:MAG: tetratricopeptide repeat protein [Nitrospirae bacterium]|nr:tetratricopeptide repeat protein [Nitrospirota bacterium]
MKYLFHCFKILLIITTLLINHSTVYAQKVQSSLFKVRSASGGFGEGWTEINLGIAYMKLSDWKTAELLFQEAHKINPDKFKTYVYYYRNLGYCYFRQGDFEKALKTYLEGLKEIPDDEWLMEMAGWSYQALGKKEESVSYLEKSASIGFSKIPESPPILMELPVMEKWKVSHGSNEKYTHLGLNGRYSLDFVMQGAKETEYMGDGSMNEDYFSFGKPVIAPADGEIVEVVLNVQDNIPNTTVNWISPGGNYIKIKHDEEIYSILEHLKHGSIVVEPNHKIKRGDVLGLVGNSGNSLQPHLHFHVSYGEEKGWISRPFKFKNYIRYKNGIEFLVKEGIPERGEIVRPAE